MPYYNIVQKEDFYGHLKRLHWIRGKIEADESVIEVGCGTGAFITTPLILQGISACGIDIGEPSIAEANRIAGMNGIKETHYFCKDVKNEEKQYDVVICSEVLEHIYDGEQAAFVDEICRLVKPGGKLIVTVPNGKGSYETGQKYFKNPVEKLVSLLRPVVRLWRKIKANIFGKAPIPAGGGLHLSLTDSPHVQWFSYEDICGLIEPRGFELRDFAGSSMFAGVIINTFLKPNKTICALNNWLGKILPKHATGFYFLFIKVKNEMVQQK